MPELLRMPEVAANTTEAVLLSWPVAENVPFSKRDAIATVETAKAVVDVEAESDGVILRTLVPPGTEVAVGEPIALIAAAGEVVPDLDAALAELGHAADAKGALALEIPEADPAPAPPAPTPEGAATPAATVAAARMAPPAPSVSTGGRVFASPLARRLARDSALVLAELTGSGPNGRIVRRDVEAAVAARSAAAPRVPTAGSQTAGDHAASAGQTHSPFDASPLEASPVAARRLAADGEDGGARVTDVPVSRQRRLIATRLTESKQDTPHFYLRGSAQVDALLALRADLNDGAEVRVSVNDLLVKAVARAHRAVPALNVSYLGEVIRHFRSVDVSVAIATEAGLVTPVVRRAEASTVTEIAATVQEFVARARSGRLRQHDLEGGSVTITNLGMYGVPEFAAIINPPQASILAVGAARPEAVVRQGAVVAATMMHLTLSVDHRAVDGAQAAEWMAALVALLEHPVRILA